jgi:hypothetical protein
MNTAPIAGQLAGTSALNAINENVKIANTQKPRLDLLGMNLLSKLLQSVSNKTIFRSRMFVWTLAGDLLGNILYYSLMGGKQKGLWWRGTLLGFLTGAGSVLFRRYPGNTVEYNTRTTKNKLITTLFYLVGGLAASALTRVLTNKEQQTGLQHQ